VFSVCLCSSPIPVTLHSYSCGTGFACKGVFITLRVTKASTLASLPFRLPQLTGRRTQENGGESTESQSLAPENFFFEGLGI